MSNIGILISSIEKRINENKRTLDISLCELAKRISKFRDRNKERVFDIIDYYYEKNPPKYKIINATLPYMGEYYKDDQVELDLKNLPKDLVLILYELSI